jgi:Fe2+ or Zn2+ uptake regulation protein
VIEFDNPLIEQVRLEFEERASVHVDCASVVFYGLCRQCQKEQVS